MLSANQFVEQLRSLLSIGDRQIRIQIDGDLIFINFINLPQGVGGAGGGAERENNRAMWMISGFHKDPTIPVERIKLKESVSVFDQNLKGKTGKPEAVAQYLASFINKLAEIPPKYTHTKPPVTSNLKKAIQLIGAGVCKNFRTDTEACRSGCKAKQILPGGSCPWEGSWDEASSECPCYR